MSKVHWQVLSASMLSEQSQQTDNAEPAAALLKGVKLQDSKISARRSLFGCH